MQIFQSHVFFLNTLWIPYLLHMLENKFWSSLWKVSFRTAVFYWFTSTNSSHHLTTIHPAILHTHTLFILFSLLILIAKCVWINNTKLCSLFTEVRVKPANLWPGYLTYECRKCAESLFENKLLENIIGDNNLLHSTQNLTDIFTTKLLQGIFEHGSLNR